MAIPSLSALKHKEGMVQAGRPFPKAAAVLEPHLAITFTRQFCKTLPRIRGSELVPKQISIHKHSWARFCCSFKITQPSLTSEIPSSFPLLLQCSQVLSLDNCSCLPLVLWESKGPQLPQEVFKAKKRAQQVTEHCQERFLTILNRGPGTALALVIINTAWKEIIWNLKKIPKTVPLHQEECSAERWGQISNSEPPNKGSRALPGYQSQGCLSSKRNF